jgi:nucleosome assembly protein 1-like 1
MQMICRRRLLSLAGQRLTRPLCTSSFAPPPAVIPAEDMGLKLRKRIASLEGLHARFERMEEEHHEQLRQVELRYMEDVARLFKRRREIISGAAEPTEEEVKASAYFEAVQEAVPTEEEAAAKHGDVVGVPAFWGSVFRSCESLRNFEDFAMSDADFAVLDYLTDVQQLPWDSNEEATAMLDGWEGEQQGADEGFALHFSFAPNPYLKNSELSLYCNGDFEVMSATGPEWREERYDPTVRWVTKKVKKKGKGGGEASKRLVAKPAESFFRIFELAPEDEDMDWDEEAAMPPQRMGGGGGGGGGVDGLMPLRQLQGEMTLRLREDVIPRAQIHYIAALHGFDAEGEDGMGFDDDDGEWEVERKGR